MNLFRKPYIMLLISLFCAHSIDAQNSDCEDAISVCNATYTETDSPSGTGQVFEMAPGTCQTGGEFNSAWYVFSPQNDGDLSFILEPNDNFDDYDWSLFDITENGCGGINNGLSPEVSCNSYGENPGIPQGSTGISTANGGSGSSNGPGNFAGPPFNEDLNVTAGSMYALVIMNYSSTLNGYTLNFGENTANIYDETPPALLDIAVDCDLQEITLEFSENVNLGNYNSSNFPLTNESGATVNATSIDGGGDEWGHIVTLEFNAPLDGGDYTTAFSATNTVEDLCGNLWQENIPFNVTPLAEISVTTDAACNGTDGSADLVIENASEGDFTIVFDNATTTSTHWEGLESGDHDLSVFNDEGCETNTTVTIPDVILTVDAGADQILCDMQTNLLATFSGGTIEWQTDPDLSFGSPNSAGTNVISSTPGPKIIQCVATLGDCTASDGLSVTFAFPPEVNINKTPLTCYGYCDASLEIQNVTNQAITAELNGNSQSGNHILFENICAGDYVLVITHSPGCVSTQDEHFASPPEVIAGFETDNWIVQTSDPTVILTSNSENADSLFWSVIGYDEISGTGEIFELVLPQQMGFYYVEHTAIDENGCSDVVVAPIEVRDEFRFYIPNSFTPNNDDINDVFYVNFSYPPEKYSLTIFDRFGETIFTSEDYAKVWTGEVHNGTHYVPDGVYSWQLKVKGVEIEEKTYMGHVTVIR